MWQKNYAITLVRILHILFNGTNSLSPAPHISVEDVMLMSIFTYQSKCLDKSVSVF